MLNGKCVALCEMEHKGMAGRPPEGRGNGVGCKLLRWLPLVINCKLSCRPSLSSARTQFKDATFNAELKATLKLVSDEQSEAGSCTSFAGRQAHLCVSSRARIFLILFSLSSYLRRRVRAVREYAKTFCTVVP